MIAGRKTLPSFELLEPRTLEEACGILANPPGAGRIVAGGTDVIACMRAGSIPGGTLVSLRSISGLDGIEETDGNVTIGAMASLGDVAAHPSVRRHCAPLAAAIESIMSVQIKNMATVVGNICAASPASDLAAALLALDADCVISGISAEVVRPVEDLWAGPRKTCLATGDIVRAIRIPRQEDGSKGSFRKLVRTATDVSKVTVAVRVTISGGTCTKARIGMSSVGPTPVRARMAEQMLVGVHLTPVVIREAGLVASRECSPIDDLRSTAVYRRSAVAVLVRRALEEAGNVERS